jgi:hypothetical protein
MPMQSGQARGQAMSTTSLEPCIRCGVRVSTDHPVSLMTVNQLSRLPLHTHVDKIVELEGISRARAQEFVDHKMSRNCQKVEPPCPGCGSLLKTWHATGCWTCGWRRDPARHLTDYYEAGA